MKQIGLILAENNSAEQKTIDLFEKELGERDQKSSIEVSLLAYDALTLWGLDETHQSAIIQYIKRKKLLTPGEVNMLITSVTEHQEKTTDTQKKVSNIL